MMNVEAAESRSNAHAIKFYIMAMAATGKSTFAGQNDSYLGYNVVDYAERIPEFSFLTRALLYFSRILPPLRRIAVKRPDMAGHFKNSYFDHVLDFILKHEDPIAVLGRKTYDTFDHQNYEGVIEFSIVLIPEEDHRQNCVARKKQMRNPLPFFHHWTTDFEKINRVRKGFQKYASKHGIPVYESIPEAIEDMHRKFGSAESVAD
jgi:hypothetical protein